LYCNDFIFLGVLAVVYFLMMVLYVFGTITAFVSVTHSVKKRVVRGEDYSAGSVFGWYLGWFCAMGYSFGIATIIYFFVKRSEIRETKAQHSQILAYFRSVNVPQAYQQQPPQQPPYPYQ
jgi:hypothetical protein